MWVIIDHAAQVKLLQQYPSDPRVLYDTLDTLCALLAHRR
jgi:hypothetical protein